MTTKRKHRRGPKVRLRHPSRGEDEHTQWLKQEKLLDTPKGVSKKKRKVKSLPGQTEIPFTP